MQNQHVAVRQQDRMLHRAIGASAALQDRARNGLEMAIAQQRMWLERGESINNFTQLVDRAAPFTRPFQGSSVGDFARRSARERRVRGQKEREDFYRKGINDSRSVAKRGGTRFMPV